MARKSSGFTSLKKRALTPPKQKRGPHANRLIGVGPVHVRPYRKVDGYDDWTGDIFLAGTAYDSFIREDACPDEADPAENRVEERVKRAEKMGESYDARLRLQHSSCRTDHYRNETRIFVRVDGQLFIT